VIERQFYYRSDSKQKIETLYVFLLSLATQRARETAPIE